MTTRVLSGIAIAVVGVLLVCSGLAATLVFHGGVATAACTTGGPTPGGSAARTPGGVGPIGAWSAEQVANATVIVAVGLRRGVPPRGWVIAVATAMQESSLINTWGGDQDSVGLFQQRPSQGWGTPEQLHDPEYAAARFYDTLLTVGGWQAMPLTEAAQTVQRSAYPDAYAKWEPAATMLVQALTGITGTGPGGCTVVISVQGWTQPVHARIVSGFHTADRPDHDGVDLSVPKGTPVLAASAGTVTVVRCNAVTADGGDYGCDRDGSARVRGCGWYVDIDHPGGIVTRYCHLLAHPTVVEGQHVDAGQVIGLSGTSGNSEGPHLHFEVHTGDDHGLPHVTDPIAFMASVGAPLQ